MQENDIIQKMVAHSPGAVVDAIAMNTYDAGERKHEYIPEREL